LLNSSARHVAVGLDSVGIAVEDLARPIELLSELGLELEGRVGRPRHRQADPSRRESWGAGMARVAIVRRQQALRGGRR
jgi:hypothetical protein